MCVLLLSCWQKKRCEFLRHISIRQTSNLHVCSCWQIFYFKSECLDTPDLLLMSVFLLADNTGASVKDPQDLMLTSVSVLLPAENTGECLKYIRLLKDLCVHLLVSR